ncbi:MAG: isoprenylcysteine carboxylmethyltransferase family protein [Alphaproteobacteria bacterium]|nr:isoprenylcysteine carboxylmethyltransferase family protein [Alphaproteobacteria bacterium]
MLLFTPGNPVAMSATGLAWLGMVIPMATARMRSAREKSAVAQRDNKSVFGIALQGVGVWLTWAGPFRFSWPATPTIWIAAVLPALVAFLSVGLFIWSQRTMGLNWSLVARTRGDHSLVQSGPFAVMRNPIYVALFGMMVATAISLGHTLNLVVSIPIYITGTMMRVMIEEKLLRATFGTAYDVYTRRVKRFIPAIW